MKHCACGIWTLEWRLFSHILFCRYAKPRFALLHQPRSSQQRSFVRKSIINVVTPGALEQWDSQHHSKEIAIHCHDPQRNKTAPVRSFKLWNIHQTFRLPEKMVEMSGIVLQQLSCNVQFIENNNSAQRRCSPNAWPRFSIDYSDHYTYHQPQSTKILISPLSRLLNESQ